ncbi:MAG: stalk domain-containing protein [Methanobacterium sp.]
MDEVKRRGGFLKMKRIFIAVLITMMMTLSWSPLVGAYSSPTVYLNGSQLYFDVPAQIINGRALVPMRTIFEALGASVEWESKTKTVVASKGSITMQMTIGLSSYYENGTAKALDVPAQLINGRTMVPLRLVAECLQCDVEYDPNTRTVNISSDTNPQETEQKFLDGSKYIGQVENGKMNGQGTYYFNNGEKYIGQFKNDFFEGQGTYTWPNGDKYVGEYKNDLRNGKGTYYYANGEIYEGQFKDNLFEGKGTFTWPDGEKYIGEYKNDQRNGQGTYYYVNGDKYIGEYKNDKMDGQGIYYYKNGDIYEGQLKNDLFEGLGSYTWANGDKYVGEYVNDDRNGEGTIYYADGTSESGIWEDGELVEIY